MNKLWALWVPGTHIKRWWFLLLVGIVFMGLSIAYLQVQLGRTIQVPAFSNDLDLYFLTRSVRALLFGTTGLVVIAISFLKLVERFFKPLVLRKEDLLDAAYRHWAPVKRLRIVIFAGPAQTEDLIQGS